MDYPALKEQITLLAEHWEKECITSGASIYSVASGSDTRRWRLPPLTSKVKSDIVSLDDLLRDFYYQPSGDVEVINAWDSAVDFLMSRVRGHPTGEMNREFYKVFPEMVFGCDVHHPYNNMVQFLYCASMHKRTIEVNSSRCILIVDGKRIGMDRTGLFTSKEGRRTRMSLDDYRQPLRCQRGGLGRRPALPATNGAYRMLLRALPHRAHEIEIGFAVAVRMGAEMERIILAHVDVVLDNSEIEIPAEGDHLSEARYLINSSVTNPIKQLATLLTPVYGAEVFLKTFGSPYQRPARNYTPHMQQKHRIALDSLAHEQANKVEIALESSKNKLLSHLFGV